MNHRPSVTRRFEISVVANSPIREFSIATVTVFLKLAKMLVESRALSRSLRSRRRSNSIIGLDIVSEGDVFPDCTFTSPRFNPDDDHVLAWALGAQSGLNATRNRCLLTLGTFRHIRILAAYEALAAIPQTALG